MAVKPLSVGMKICCEGGMGINYLRVEEISCDKFKARFLSGAKHVMEYPLTEYGTVFLPTEEE
jgi:hypothetical protein